MMTLDNISFSYQDKNVLNQITLAIQPGQITTIIGPNGSGKSTLLKIAAGLIEPQKGNVYLDDRNIKTIKPLDLAKKIALLPQTNPFPAIKAWDMVASGRYPYHHGFGKQTDLDRAIIKNAMCATSCYPYRDKPLNQLSGGERQRVFIATVLAQKTPWIFLDEPTTYVDMQYAFEIMALVRREKELHNKTFVLVLHDLGLAFHYSNRIILMDKGRVVAHDTASNVLGSNAVPRVFHIDISPVIIKEETYYVFHPRTQS